MGLGKTKKEFIAQLESLDTFDKLHCLLAIMLWYPSMIIDECVDFIVEHQCANPGCGKFSPVKCANCKVARYCDQKCQEDDFDEHSQKCSELKRMRKDNVEIGPGKKTKDFVSYQFFVSKMRAKIFEHHAEPLLSVGRQQFFKTKIKKRDYFRLSV